MVFAAGAATAIALANVAISLFTSAAVDWLIWRAVTGSGMANLEVYWLIKAFFNWKLRAGHVLSQSTSSGSGLANLEVDWLEVNWLIFR